jgi:uncharacterized coiled-coil protein SlyX
MADLSAHAQNLLLEGLERENRLIAQLIELRNELDNNHMVMDGMNGALNKMHARVERMEGQIKSLEDMLQERNDHIDRLEAIPKPPAPLPGITLEALAVLCKQQRSLEIERLRGIVAERDVEIQRLYDELDESDTMED